MTLILKSDVSANKFISDRAGIRIPNYYLSADFVNQSYELNGLASAFSDIFDYTKPSASYIIEDKEIKSVPANTPIFSDPNNNGKGLWMQNGGVGNALGAGDKKTNQTLNVLSGRVGVEHSLQVWGSGSVSVSGAIELVSITATATKDKLVIFKPTSTGAINFTVAGDVEYYQVQHNFAHEYVQPAPSAAPTNNLKIKSDIVSTLSSFVLIFRMTPYLESGPSANTSLMEVNGTNVMSGYINRTDNKAFIRMRNDNISVGATADYIEYDKDIALVVNYGQDGRMSVYKNGKKLSETEFNPASLLQSITFGRNTVFSTTHLAFTGLIKNIALYKINLTQDELISLSKSFS